MAKIIKLGSLPPDHPIYTGGPEMFSPLVFRPSSMNSAPTTAGETPPSPSPTPEENPMLSAQDGLEAALNRAVDAYKGVY